MLSLAGAGDNEGDRNETPCLDPHGQPRSLARGSEEGGIEGGGRNGLFFETRGRNLNG